VIADSSGVDGDFYLDNDTHKIYKRVSGVWTEQASLSGFGGVVSYSTTWPSSLGSSGQALRTTDGAGTLEWFTPEVGDITSVTAGTNLSGGGTSGDITLNLGTTITGLTSVTSTGFTGDVTGNVSGTAATVTGAAQTAITSVGTLSSLVVTGDLTVDTDTLYVDSGDDRVGIGTTSPDKLLHLAGDQIMLRMTDDTEGTGSDTYLDLHQGANSYLTSTAKLGLGSGGTYNQMILMEDGKIGIGTTAPTQQLHVNGTNASSALFESSASSTWIQIKSGTPSWQIGAAVNGLQFYSDETATYPLTLNKNGNLGLGIGNNEPSHLLTLESDSSPNHLKILNTSASTAIQGAGIMLAHDDGAAMGDGHRLGLIQFQGAEDASSTMKVGGSISCLTEAAWSDTVNDASLVFKTNAGNDVLTERMRIQNDGTIHLPNDKPISWGDAGDHILGNSTSHHVQLWANNSPVLTATSTGVGIGTAAPAKALDVRTGDIIVWGEDGFNATDETARIYFGDAGFYIGSQHGKGLRFGTYGVGDAMVIEQTTGNVGIGTISPAQKLHVSGTATKIRIEDTSEVGDHWMDIYQAYNSYIYSKNALYFDVNGNDAGTALSILTDGSVGIGTSTPTQLLHLVSSGDGHILLEGTNSTTGVGFIVKNNQATTGRQWRMDSNGNGNFDIRDDTAGAIRLSVDSGGLIDLAAGKLTIAGDDGDDGDVLTSDGAGGIAWVAAGAASQLWTEDGSDVYRSSGKVGIGEAAPEHALTVVSANNDSYDAVAGFYTNNKSVGVEIHNQGIGITNETADGSTALDANTNFRIDARGTGHVIINTSDGANVGIGTTAPAYPLDCYKAGVEVSGNWYDVARFIEPAASKGIHLGYDNGEAGVGIIAPSGATSSLAFWTHGGSWAERMRIDSSGAVGIGTTDVEIAGESARSKLVVSNSTGAYMMMHRAEAAASVAADDILGGYMFGGDTASNEIGAMITAEADAAWTAADYDYPSRLKFWTQSDGTGNQFSGANKCRMLIDSSGNVAIGTDAPVKKLHIHGTDDTYIKITNDDTGATVDDGLEIGLTGDEDGMIRLREAGTLQLATGGGAAALTVDSSQNVGIGTTAPSSPLHVHGDPGTSNYLTYLYNSGGSGAKHGLNTQIASSDATAYGLRVNTGGDSNALAVMGDGKVGIGTAAPQLVTLDVVGAIAQSGAVWTTGARANSLVIDNNAGNARLHAVGADATTQGSFEFFTAETDGGATSRMVIASDGAVQIADGARLSLRTTDKTTFISAPEANKMQFVTGDVVRAIIDSAGKVGIGTTAPSSKLHIGGSGTSTVRVERAAISDDAGIRLCTGSTQDWYIGTGALANDKSLEFYYDNSVGASRLSISEAGNVGIGTAAPSQVLEVRKDQNGGTVAQVTNDTAGTAAQAQLRVRSNSALGLITVQDDGYTSSGVYQADALSVFSASSASGGLVLGTEGDHNVSFYQNNAVKMTLDGTGLGIGGTPSQPLHVTSAENQVALIESTDAYAELGLKDNTTSSGGVQLGAVGDAFYAIAGSAERMRIDSSGNVGIGTAAPAQKLDIATGFVKCDTGYGYGWGDLNTGMFGRGTADASSYLGLRVNGGTNALHIDSAGLVGIGTAAPTAKLEINQTAATRGFQVIRNVDQVNTEALAYFTDEHPTSTQATVRIRNDGTGDALQVMDASSPALIVDGSGFVGIGTAAPTSPLHVAGTTTDGSTLAQFTQAGSGRAFQVSRNVTGATRQMVAFAQTAPAAGTCPAVLIQQADVGEVALGINSDGSISVGSYGFSVTDGGDVYAAGQIQQAVETLTTGDTVNIDFSKSNLQTFTLDGNESQTALTGSNYAAGRTVRLMIDMTNDSHMVGIEQPSEWNNVGDDPSSASTMGLVICDLTCWTGADTGVTANWTISGI